MHAFWVTKLSVGCVNNEWNCNSLHLTCMHGCMIMSLPYLQLRKKKLHSFISELVYKHYTVTPVQRLSAWRINRLLWIILVMMMPHQQWKLWIQFPTRLLQGSRPGYISHNSLHWCSPFHHYVLLSATGDIGERVAVNSWLLKLIECMIEHDHACLSLIIGPCWIITPPRCQSKPTSSKWERMERSRRWH